MQTASFELLRETLVDVDIPEEEIAGQADLRNDLDIDSTELVEIVASINTKIGTRIPSKSLKGIRKVDELADLVERERSRAEN